MKCVVDAGIIVTKTLGLASGLRHVRETEWTQGVSLQNIREESGR